MRRNFCQGRISGVVIAEMLEVNYEAFKKQWQKRLKDEGKGRKACDVTLLEMREFIEEKYEQRKKSDVDAQVDAMFPGLSDD